MKTVGDKVNDYIKNNMKKEGVPGIAIVTVSPEQKLNYYCLGNAKYGKKVSNETVFQLASVSKSFTALGIMKLVEKGMLDLCRPINSYLKRLQLPEKNFSSNEITVEDVLCHTSGIKRMGYFGTTNINKVVTIDVSINNTINKVKYLYDDHNQGKILYSGVNYSLLQLLVEDIMDMKFSDFMKTYILELLDMNNSSFEWREDLGKLIAREHGLWGMPLQRRYYSESAAAGLYSNIEDVGKFLVRMIQNYKQDDLLKKESFDYLLKRTNRINPLAKGFYTATCAKTKIVYSVGLNRGWNSYISMIPNKDIGIAILSNGMFSGRLLANAVGIWYEESIGELSEINKSILSLNLEKRSDMLKRFLSYSKFN